MKILMAILVAAAVLIGAIALTNLRYRDVEQIAHDAEPSQLADQLTEN